MICLLRRSVLVSVFASAVVSLVASFKVMGVIV